MVLAEGVWLSYHSQEAFKGARTLYAAGSSSNTLSINRKPTRLRNGASEIRSQD